MEVFSVVVTRGQARSVRVPCSAKLNNARQLVISFNFCSDFVGVESFSREMCVDVGFCVSFLFMCRFVP